MHLWLIVPLAAAAYLKSIYLGNQIERTIREFPEVTQVVSKLGRPDRATEAMGIEESDSYLVLKPRSEWKCCKSKDKLVSKMSERLSHIPGAAFVFTQPMEMRMDEVVTGIRGDLALKIYGEDLDTLDQLGARAVHLISVVHGAAEVQKDSSMGIAELRVETDRQELARYGLNPLVAEGRYRRSGPICESCLRSCCLISHLPGLLALTASYLRHCPFASLYGNGGF